MANKCLSIFLILPAIAMSLSNKKENGGIKFSSAHFRDGIGYVRPIDLAGYNAKMNLSTLISNIMNPSKSQHKLVYSGLDMAPQSLNEKEAEARKKTDRVYKKPLRLNMDGLGRVPNPFEMESDSDSDEYPVMRNRPTSEEKVFLQYDIADDLGDDFLRISLK